MFGMILNEVKKNMPQIKLALIQELKNDENFRMAFVLSLRKEIAWALVHDVDFPKSLKEVTNL